MEQLLQLQLLSSQLTSWQRWFGFFFCFKLCIILKPVKLLGMWILLEVRMLRLCKNCVYPSANTLKCLLVHPICITLSFKNPGYVKSSICKTWVLEVAALGSVCAGPAGPVMIQYRAKREQVTVGGWAACAPCFSFLLLFLPSALTSFLLLSALFFPRLYLSLSFLLRSSAQTRLWPSRWRVRLWDLRAEQWLENMPFWEQRGQNGSI